MKQSVALARKTIWSAVKCVFVSIAKISQGSWNISIRQRWRKPKWRWWYWQLGLLITFVMLTDSFFIYVIIYLLIKDISLFLITFCRPESNYLTETLFQKLTFTFSITNLALLNQVMENFELYFDFILRLLFWVLLVRRNWRLNFTDQSVNFLRSLKKKFRDQLSWQSPYKKKVLSQKI